MAVLPRMTLLAALLALPLFGCASRPPATDAAGQTDFDQTNDPYEPANRFFYKVNDALDAVILKPAALAYVNVLPPAARTGVHNVLQNLNSPVLLANDMMQGSPRRSGDTFMRFLINSTAGVAGVFDVANDWGYPYHDTDFGITLALWGVSEGPFLYLPVLGPSNPRDAFGYGVDTGIDPLTYIGQGAIVSDLRYGRFGLYAVDLRANLLGTISGIKKGALDPYATFRSLYRQNRASAIKATEDDERATVPDWYASPSAR
jgi:phospholipid-binding lipoprotein MlaA